MINRWYKKRFSDPHAVSLALILIGGFITIYFFGRLIVPFLVAIVLSYLLEWPVARLTQYKVPRVLAVIIVLILFCSLAMIALFGVIPTIWSQVGNLLNDIPSMYLELQEVVRSIPDRFPEFATIASAELLLDDTKNNLLKLGESALKGSLASLVNLASLAVYVILVPLLIFFLLKDKDELIDGVTSFLPQNRKLANQVWLEMNQQITNYIRGKVSEILIVGGVTYIAFFLMDLRYAALLAFAVGISVLIPYIGAAIVTIPIAMVGLFQWGLSPEFYWLLFIYAVIQALDGNVLVPILFSEAVNLHPVMIIVSVLVFGGLWGFWGIFFAIPLATLVKAVINAFTSATSIEVEPSEVKL